MNVERKKEEKKEKKESRKRRSVTKVVHLGLAMRSPRGQGDNRRPWIAINAKKTDTMVAAFMEGKPKAGTEFFAGEGGQGPTER